MQLRPETLDMITRTVMTYGVKSKKTARAIVIAVLRWERTLYSLHLKRSLAGKKVGRPRKMTPAMADKARALRAQGLSYRAIGEQLGVRGDTVRYELLPLKKRRVVMQKLRENVDRWRAAREVPI